MKNEPHGRSASAAPCRDNDDWAADAVEKLSITYRLTRRESAIVAIMIPGLSNKAIASSCGITVQTVKDHLKSVYAKVGVHQRTALVARVIGLDRT